MTCTIWHNPRCSKSRAALKYLQDNGHAPQVRLYLDEGPSAPELVELQKLLGIPAIEFTRTGETVFRDLGLNKTSSSAELITAMAENPVLIERPIVFANGKARVGRPLENVLEIL
ncbi:MAG: arsenate reductase (glutaredoxin) [Paracoccaceae bacterium]